jgi:hypothetical protein
MAVKRPPKRGSREWKRNISRKLKGIKRSDKTRRKMSDSQIEKNKDPKFKASLSAGAKKRYEDPAQREHQSEILKGRYKDPLEREKLAQRWRDYWADPKNREAQSKRLHEYTILARRRSRIRGYYYASKCANFDGPVPFRSRNPELRIMRHLDRSPIVLEWSYESVRVDYVARGRERYTLVDFEVELIDGTMLLIEGKAKNFLYKFRAKRKAIIKWCRQNYYLFVLVLDTQMKWRL